METDDEKYDIGRYDSARDSDQRSDRDTKRSEAKYQKLSAAHKRKHPEQSCFDGAFQSSPANDLPEVKRGRKRKHYLLGDLWLPGEVSVLFGETSVGKSIFAVQIAESIANGYGLALFPRPRPCRVAYVDIENSAEQFRDRYSCASNVLGRLPVRHQFPRRLERAAATDPTIPEAFNGDVRRYLRHSIRLLFQQSKADIFVVDSLSGLESPSGGSSDIVRWMRFFREVASEGYSILVVARSKPRRRHTNSDTGRPSPVFSPLSLLDVPRPIADMAHSVFAIGTSTIGPDIRYVKHLSSHSAQIYFGAERVLTYRIERSPGVQAKPPAKPNATEPAPKIVRIADPNLRVLNPELPPTPYIGFDLIGMQNESDHLRDYQAENRFVEQLEERRRNPTRRPNPTVDMFLSKDYEKYLLGP